MSLTDDETKQFLKNEERLWDLAAITAAPTIQQILYEGFKEHLNSGFAIVDYKCEVTAKLSYNLADALMAERRKRLAEPSLAPPSDLKP